ncbi:hypothetical protein BCV70DRAFT_198542 [Testicularia cyperi]|uniref:cAMP-independent regulatory protein pac2 n=1 Tax=Testicularia cyperi TaxID=1882483 RepID=A0A317XVE8_9BASI|nr:hypothetical protein BCV70DRAFT_198542 [Testicularia cyperi]
MHPASSSRLSMSRPDLARSQTVPRGPPYPAPPHGPAYPDYGHHHHQHHNSAQHHYQDRAYPSHAPPSFARQHHSYYDERGPLPPPPMHHRQSAKEEALYAHEARHYRVPSSPSQQMHPPLHGAGYAPSGYHNAYPHPHHMHPHASFSSTSSSSSMHSMRGSIGGMGLPVGSHQQPTYRGHIKTTKDAILLLAACDLSDDAGGSGLVPPRRVTRRLLDSERAELICSGSIFVWDEKEAGMRRWTDGKCWSASRVSGCFLTYRELEARKKPSSSITGGPTSNLYKTEGLIKQSFSMTTTSGRKLHVISYYTKRDVREGLLRRVSEDPRFVGEGGGEWGLEVDEQEYPDPISRAGDLPPGVNPDELEGSQSPPSTPAQPPIEHRGCVVRGLDAVVDDRQYYDKPLRSPSTAVSAFHHTDRMPLSPKDHDVSPRQRMSGVETTRTSKEALVRDLPMIKGEYRGPELASYPPEVTPLHEARGLLPIRPIPVDSKYPVPVQRRSSLEYLHPQHRPAAPGSILHEPSISFDRKRAYGDPRGPEAAEDAFQSVRPVRPRLQRLRSSSMGDGAGFADGLLAPIRPLGRAGSDDDGISKLRSTHAGPTGSKEQHDSAVGALLSLRSSTGSSSDEAAAVRSTLSTTGTGFARSPSASTPGTSDSNNEATASKPAFSHTDRAALDRFRIRI